MCRVCNGTGFVYSGNGHRMSKYPWAEKHASEVCTNCDNASPAKIRERYYRLKVTPEEAAARKAKVEKRINDALALWNKMEQERISQ